MARYTERVYFTVPSDVKAGWKAIAKARGISLSQLIRDATAIESLGTKHDNIRL